MFKELCVVLVVACYNLVEPGGNETTVRSKTQDFSLINLLHQNRQVPLWTNPERMKKSLYREPAGNLVYFLCQADGAQPLTAKWFKNGESITNEGRPGGYRFRHRNQMIVLESLVVSDIGNYMCVISNRFGSINHTYELYVAERSPHKPILQFGLPANKTAFVGDDVEFKCIIFSDPPVHIQWLKHIDINGSQINPENNSSYVKLLKESGVGTDSPTILTLRNISREDAGVYTCRVENVIGMTQNSAWLTIVGPIKDTNPAAVVLRRTRFLTAKVSKTMKKIHRQLIRAKKITSWTNNGELYIDPAEQLITNIMDGVENLSYSIGRLVVYT